MKCTYLLLIAFVLSCKSKKENDGSILTVVGGESCWIKVDTIGNDTIFMGHSTPIHDTIYIHDTVYKKKMVFKNELPIITRKGDTIFLSDPFIFEEIKPKNVDSSGWVSFSDSEVYKIKRKHQ